MAKIFTAEEDLLFSPWNTGIDQIFEKHHFNDSQEYSLAEIINASPRLLKKIKKVRESLKEVKFYDESDIFKGGDLKWQNR